MNKNKLREFAISNSLFKPTTLTAAFEKMRFVQADPIQSPARAQDLILRHRVKNYLKDNLEAKYPELNIEEDYLYAHGFMITELWKLLHPRKDVKLTKLDKQVLEYARNTNEINPKDLVTHFGSKRETNWWGGKSQATRMSLERLHYYGLIKISKRQGGVRIYQAMQPEKSTLTLEERLQQLILAIVEILMPVTHSTLRQSLHRLRRHFGTTQPFINKLISDGQLVVQKIDEIEYLWIPRKKLSSKIPETVKFLAPFDPIVWDRVRFEHIWGWRYRFEAYTPKAKRIRGYYAMPLLWRDKIIGWANVTKQGEVELGFVAGQPSELKFQNALDFEIESIRKFLKLQS